MAVPWIASFGSALVSQVYETESVGISGDPFLNLLAGFDTDLELEELVDALHDVETRMSLINAFDPMSSHQ